MSETFKERKRKEREKKLQEARKKQRRKMLIASFIIILFLTLILFFLNSSYFEVKKVEVSKTKNISPEIIEKSKSLLIGKNIFRAPIGKARQVLSSDIWVNKVEISRDYPDKLIVSIGERKPVAQVSKEGIFYVVADDGMVLKRSVESEGLIEIADLPLKNIQVGAFLKSKEFEEAMKVYRHLDPDIKKKVMVISASSKDRLIFYIDGIEVIYGDTAYLEEKNKILKEILKREGKKVISIDLRVPDTPVVKTQP